MTDPTPNRVEEARAFADGLHWYEDVEDGTGEDIALRDAYVHLNVVIARLGAIRAKVEEAERFGRSATSAEAALIAYETAGEHIIALCDGSVDP